MRPTCILKLIPRAGGPPGKPRIRTPGDSNPLADAMRFLRGRLGLPPPVLGLFLVAFPMGAQRLNLYFHLFFVFGWGGLHPVLLKVLLGLRPIFNIHWVSPPPFPLFVSFCCYCDEQEEIDTHEIEVPAGTIIASG